MDEITGERVNKEGSGRGAEGDGEEISEGKPFDRGHAAVFRGEGWADCGRAWESGWIKRKKKKEGEGSVSKGEGLGVQSGK